MNNTKELLTNMLIGEPISGDSGFANLLSIKNEYYSFKLDEVFEEINRDSVVQSEFLPEFNDLLYTFFNRYLSENGSVYFTKTPSWQNIYEEIYSEENDVSLFWKTNMLYYVKTDINYNNLEVEIEHNSQKYKVRFTTDLLEQKKSNEKLNLVFSFKEVITENDKNVYVLNVVKSTHGRKTKTDKISKDSKLPIEVVQKSIRAFNKQSSVDYFINKDAKKFLDKQLDMFLNQILIDEKNIFEQNRLNQLKKVKYYASRIINVIADFEDELTLIWNKPKFVKNSNYVITIDRLNETALDLIENSNGFIDQVDEWKKFEFIEKERNPNQINLKEVEPELSFLPIDTKHFHDIKNELLATIDDIDETLDGLLIRSENYQALNTIENKFKGSIQTIYIDPPFNTGKDFTYIDKFQDSTWLSLMSDRLDFVPDLLNENGSFWLHLDENANVYGKYLIERHFNDVTEIIFDTNATKDEEADLFGYKSFGDNFQLKHQTIFYSRNSESYAFNKLWKPNRNTTELNIGWLDLISRPKDYKKAKRIADNEYYIEYWKDGILELMPIDVDNESIFPVGDIWNDIFSFTQSEMRVSESFSFTSSQKPENLMRRILQSSTNQRDIILDFFTGIGTSLATAHKLNRRWIGIEMGDHIDDWYFDGDTEKLGVKGRLKYVLFGDQRIAKLNRRPHLSKDVNWQGSGFFKYYSLEQYEETLKNSSYQSIRLNDGEQIQYLFNSSEKLTNCVEIRDNEITFLLDEVYPESDIIETISLLTGLSIKTIDSEKFVLSNGSETLTFLHDLNSMGEEKKSYLLNILAPCLWWEAKINE